MRTSLLALAVTLTVLALACEDVKGTPIAKEMESGDASSTNAIGYTDSGSTGMDASTNSDADTSTGSDADTKALSCQEKLQHSDFFGPCTKEDDGKVCTGGCLACRCEQGRWQPCTTSGACLGDGG
jgi:hypothetical protein